jgi:hypothetical protein
MAKRARNRRAKSTKGWAKRAPKTKAERKALKARCGAGAFLQPGKLAFPIMAKTGPCVPDCEGLRAAKSRAAQFGHRAIAKRAARAGKSRSCRWA